MTGKGKQTLGTVITVVVGILGAAGLALYSLINAMQSPLHPNIQAIPSSADAPPSSAWAGAVARARETARAGLVEFNLPGLSVAVGVEGELVWAEGLGWADLTERVPVTPRMRFRIGHVSKSMTSAGVGILLEAGRIRLDDEIQAYVPEFPRKQWPITVRQLMAHTAGVRHYNSEEDYMPSSHCERAAEGLQRFAPHPLLFEPDTQARYSTFGWVLVSAAIEAAAGEPLLAFMRRQVFEPLGMTGTTMDSGSAPMPDRVTFYYPRFSGDPTSGSEPPQAVDYSCFSGAGGFLSTPSDLVRFGIALGDRRLLKRSTIAELQMAQQLASGDKTEYGLGWTLQTVTLNGEPTPVAGHASLTLLGGSTSFLTFPEHRMVVAVTSNTSRAQTRAIALRLAEIFAER